MPRPSLASATRTKSLGARTVRQKLQQKGVASSIVDETIEARYAGTDEEALARQYLERKRIRKPEDEKRRRA